LKNTKLRFQGFALGIKQLHLLQHLLSLSLIGKYPPTLVSTLIYCPPTASFHHVTDIRTKKHSPEPWTV
jgi:hypothetical protein